MTIPSRCSIPDASDRSGGLRRLVGERKALFNVAHLVCVLAWRRRVEADAGPSVLTVLLGLLARVGSC